MGAESNVGHRPLGRWGSALLLREQSWEARFHNYEHLPFPVIFFLVATVSAFLRDRRRSPWAFPCGWTNPRRIRSKFVVVTKAVSSPSVTNAYGLPLDSLRR